MMVKAKLGQGQPLYQHNLVNHKQDRKTGRGEGHKKDNLDTIAQGKVPKSEICCTLGGLGSAFFPPIRHQQISDIFFSLFLLLPVVVVWWSDKIVTHFTFKSFLTFP